MKNGIYLFCLALAGLAACNNPVDTPEASLAFAFSHTYQGAPLVLNAQTYENEAGNQLVVEDVLYYISNITLQNTQTGAIWQEPESYHLVSADPAQERLGFTLKGMPAGNYDRLSFSIGVDETVNTSLDNVGDLDPSNAMAWNWITGYKFMLLEGRYLVPGADPAGLVLHIGTNANYRTLSFDLASPNTLDFTQPKALSLSMGVAVEQLFKNPHTIDLAQKAVIMFEEEAGLVADNYAQGMFTVEEVTTN